MSKTKETGPARYWIRNEFGRVWGPFSIDAVGRVQLGKGEALARAQVSVDGRTFKPIADHPEVLKAIEVAAASGPPPKRYTQADQTPPPVVEVTPVRPPPPPPTPRVVAEVPVEDPGPPASGDLAEHSTLALYARAAATKAAGRLSITTASGVFVVYFKKGVPERVEAPGGAADLARFLTKREAAAADAVQRALDLCGGPDGDLVDALVALQIVQPQDIFRHLGEHQVELLERVFLQEEGSFAWEAGAVAPAGSFPLGQRWQLYCEGLRRMPPGAVRRRLGDRATRAIYRSSGPRATLEELRLSAQELRVVQLFDGTRSPEGTCALLPGERDAVMRTALLLAEVAFVSFGPELTGAGEPPRVGADDAPIVEKRSAFEDPSGASGDGTIGIGRVALKSVAVRAEPRPTPASGTTPVEAPAAVITPPPAVITPPPAPVITPPPPPAPVSPPAAKSAPPPAPKPAQAAPPKPPPAPVAKPPPAPVAKPPPPAAKPPPTPGRAAPPVMGTAAHVKPPERQTDPVAELAESRAQLEKWQGATLFEVLGVTKKAGAGEVKNAYFALARRHHPDTASDPSNLELREAKAALTARINEAYQTLSDEKARADYLDELDGAAANIDVGPILQAEEDFLRATILVKARKYQEALDLIEGAIRMNPNEAEFYAWRAWARFVSAKEKRAEYDDAVAECQKALKMSERCVAAHLFIGQMSKIVGETARAEKAFKAVLALEPDNIDAKRELRAKP